MARHLTQEERDRIAQRHHHGFLQGEIAEALERDPGTISRELGRNRVGGEYFAAQAHDLAQHRRRQRPLARKLDDPELNAAVRRGLAQEWSPEQIAGAQQRAHPDDVRRHLSARTIYAWIEQRLRLGDFEGDTVLGPPGTGGLVTLVCRRSRLTILTKIQSQDADHVHQRIQQRLKELAEDRRHSLTFDNGTEFARCQRLEKHLHLQLYFADPGCPYQRGTNENTNGLIRQYFPKGTDFRTISHCEVRRVENLLNTRPRDCLGFETPASVFHNETSTDNCN